MRMYISLMALLSGGRIMASRFFFTKSVARVSFQMVAEVKDLVVSVLIHGGILQGRVLKPHFHFNLLGILFLPSLAGDRPAGGFLGL